MPILAQETSLFPADLLTVVQSQLAAGPPVDDDSPRWWSMYTRSRQEKQLMRKLLALKTPFCCPTIERRHRSPNGRVRRVYEPLFANYVFVYGDPSARYAALTTNCVSKCQRVGDCHQLTYDLSQIQRLIETGEPLSPEARLLPGDFVRVKTGSFAGFEGTVVQRKNETRLLVAVNFMQQGASVLLEDCQLEYLGSPQHGKGSAKGSIDVVYDLGATRYETSLKK